MSRRVMVALLIAAGAQAQDRPKFEVASVRQVADGAAMGEPGKRDAGGAACREVFRVDGAQLRIDCASMIALIATGFRVAPDRVKGPDWMMAIRAPKFRIAAKIPDGAPVSQVPEMVQALLADRFGMVVHRAPVEQEMYALVVAKGGPKVDEAKAADFANGDEAPPTSQAGEVVMRTVANADGKGFTILISSPRMGSVRETEGANLVHRWEAPNTSFAGLAELLDRVMPLALPVVDQTGRGGRYGVTFEVSLNEILRRENPADLEVVAVRAFNDGLRKVGLQLERRKGPVEMLTVDHVEKAPTEN